MDKLNKDELLSIKAGGWGITFGIISSVVFLIGVIDGYIHPKSCNC